MSSLHKAGKFVGDLLKANDQARADYRMSKQSRFVKRKTGLAAGGEAGPVHSAGMQLADKQAWPVADLRCDWTEECPIEAIAKAWEVYKPQLDAYVTRALDPRAAPSYGVPGDE